MLVLRPQQQPLALAQELLWLLPLSTTSVSPHVILPLVELAKVQCYEKLTLWTVSLVV
jgi:hypothetical protein